jgi:hypothetical protein
MAEKPSPECGTSLSLKLIFDTSAFSGGNVQDAGRLSDMIVPIEGKVNSPINWGVPRPYPIHLQPLIDQKILESEVALSERTGS